MPVGTISSSRDTVGLAVVNYKVPVLETREEVLANARRIAGFIDGAKRGYPGLDLIVFPEFSLQGFHPVKWPELTTTVDGPEVAIFAEACRRNKVWGVFSLTGEANPSGRNPFNTFILLNDKGELALRYRKIHPWVPMEPWTPGDLGVPVAEGPKGLRIAGLVCYDANHPEVVREAVMNGAELVIRIQGYMHPTNLQQKLISQVRAWENNAYFAVANLTGRDLVYSFFGGSNIVNFDGTILAECDSSPDQVQYALLSVSAIRDARRTWTAENHLFNLTHRGYTALPESDGLAECPYSWYRTWITEPDKAREIVRALTRPSSRVSD